MAVSPARCTDWVAKLRLARFRIRELETDLAIIYER
jgi:hypothetical protein